MNYKTNILPEDKIEGFIALFDILGFKTWLETEGLDKVSETLQSIIDYVNSSNDHINKVLNKPNNKPIIGTKNYADTLLIYTYGINNDCFDALITACDFMFLAALEAKRPIRGATAVGTMIMSKSLALGKPIIEAHDKEKKQEWIGCWITKKCIESITPEALKDLIKEGTIVEYPIPLKDGDVETLYAFNWIKSLLQKNTFEQDKDRFFDKRNQEGWTIERKHKNTENFIKFCKDR